MRMTNAEKQAAYRQRLKAKANDKKLQAEIAEKKRIDDELSALRGENSKLKADNAALKTTKTVELERAFLRGVLRGCGFIRTQNLRDAVYCFRYYYLNQKKCAELSDCLFDFEPEGFNVAPEVLEKWVKAGVFDENGLPNVFLR